MGDRQLVSIIDDEESMRQAIDGLLRSAGFQVAAFTSAEEFLRSDHLRTTRCLILDWRMPGMDDLELQQRLASDGHRIPIVILTAHGDDEVRSRALGAGAAAFLAKPLNGEVLLAAGTAALGKR
jgi:FixJ family two-component response regulator